MKHAALALCSLPWNRTTGGDELRLDKEEAAELPSKRKSRDEGKVLSELRYSSPVK